MTAERLVRSLARRFSSPLHPAEDLAQELRLRYIALEAQYGPDTQYIASKALKTHCIDLVTGHRQWTGHKPVRGHREPLRGITAPLEWAPETASRDQAPLDTSVRSAVRSLPQRDRLYVWFRFYEDQPNNIAAERAGVGKNRWPVIREVLAEKLRAA